MRLFPLWKYSEFFKKETSFRTTNQRSFRNLFFKVQVDVKSSGRVEETSLVVLKIGLEQKVSIRFPFFLFSLLLLSLEHSIRRKFFTFSSRKCIWLAFNSELEKNKVKMNKERRPLLLLFLKFSRLIGESLLSQSKSIRHKKVLHLTISYLHYFHSFIMLRRIKLKWSYTKWGAEE